MVLIQRPVQPVPPEPPAPPSPTDDAWRTLQLLMDSIKHAEAKAAAAAVTAALSLRG